MSFWDTIKAKTDELLSHDLVSKAGEIGQGVLDISYKLGESRNPISIGSAALSGINLFADVMNVQINGPIYHYIQKNNLKLRHGRLHQLLLSSGIDKVAKIKQVSRFHNALLFCIDIGPLTKIYFHDSSDREDGEVPASSHYYQCKDFDYGPLHDFFWTKYPNGLTVESKEVQMQEHVNQNTLSMSDIPYNNVYFQTTEHQIDEIVDYIKVSKESEVSRSFLLYGPPGTGKTTWVEQIANKFKNRLLKIDALTLAELLGGELDNLMRILNPEIVLFDDFDRLSFDQVEGQLLQITDHIKRKYPSVVFFATINDHTKISPAVLRTGRFDEKIKFDLPDMENVMLLLREYAKIELDDALFNEKEVKSVINDLEVPFTPAECKEAILRKKLRPSLSWISIFSDLEEYQNFGAGNEMYME